MIKLLFKQVGQGDSVILEWATDGKNCVGIIDCNLYNGTNPTVEYLKTKSDYSIEFIILSHFHFDHFSGMADLFEYCRDKKIVIRFFLHSLAPFIGELYDRIHTSKKEEKAIDRFFETYETMKGTVEDSYAVHRRVEPLRLTDNVKLSFLAPAGKVYDEMSKQLSRKVNKIVTTPADVNKLATICLLQFDDKGVLLTSDAVKRSFKELRSKISETIVLAQIPHHGSWGNVDEPFWKKLLKKDKCPAVFSVGDEPKDKLPNMQTVEFVDSLAFEIFSTANVHGIKTYFADREPSKDAFEKSRILDGFSKLKGRTSKSDEGAPTCDPKLSGDKIFTVP